MTRRLIVAAMVAAGLVVLTGCRVEGRITVRSEHAIEVDVTVHAKRSPYCNGDLAGLATTPGRDADGVVTSCRYTGIVDPVALDMGVAAVTDAGEYRVVTINPLQAAAGRLPRIDNDVDGIDVTIAMPGDVVEANGGMPAGSELRLSDPAALELPGGVRVMSLNHAGPASTLWWGAGGAALGVLSTATAVVLWRGRRPPGRADGVDEWPESGRAWFNEPSDDTHGLPAPEGSGPGRWGEGPWNRGRSKRGRWNLSRANLDSECLVRANRDRGFPNAATGRSGRRTEVRPWADAGDVQP